MKKINKLLLLGIVTLFVSCSSCQVEKNNQRVWSNLPAYTQVFENQNELGLTSDIYDGIWEGEMVPQIPRVVNPSPEIKRWSEGEGRNYLNEETDNARK